MVIYVMQTHMVLYCASGLYLQYVLNWRLNVHLLILDFIGVVILDSQGVMLPMLYLAGENLELLSTTLARATIKIRDTPAGCHAANASSEAMSDHEGRRRRFAFMRLILLWGDRMPKPLPRVIPPAQKGFQGGPKHRQEDTPQKPPFFLSALHVTVTSLHCHNCSTIRHSAARY